MKWLGGIILNAALFLFLSWLIPSFHVSDIVSALVASFILAVVNMIIRPILVFLTFPVTIISLGLFLFVINAIMLLLTTKLVGDGFVIDGFGSALLIAVLLSILNVIINSTFIKPKRNR